MPRKKEPQHTLINFRASERFRDQMQKRAAEKEMTVTAYLKQLVLTDIEASK